MSNHVESTKESPKVGAMVAHASSGTITEITRVAIDPHDRRLVAFSVRRRDHNDHLTWIYHDYPAKEWIDGKFVPVEVESETREPARSKDGEESAHDGAQPLQTKRDLQFWSRVFGLPSDELEAFAKEADARGVTMSTWLRGLGRKAVGLDP